MSNVHFPKEIMQARKKLRGALLYAFLRNQTTPPAVNDATRHALDILTNAPNVDYVIDQLTNKERTLIQVANDLTRMSPVMTTCGRKNTVWLDGKPYADLEMAGTNLLVLLRRPPEYRVAHFIFQEAESRNRDVITRDGGGDLYNRIGRIARTLDGAIILSDGVDITLDRNLTLFPTDRFSSLTSNNKIMIRHQDGAVRCRPFTDALWTERRIVADTLSLASVDIAINDLSVRNLALSNATLKTRRLQPKMIRGWNSSILCADKPPVLNPDWRLTDCTIRQENPNQTNSKSDREQTRDPTPL